jgi:predicted RNA-binding protein YlxR (DUF448 family)
MKKTSASRPDGSRRAPQRTCIACRRVKDKRALVRLVRTVGGNVEIDSIGKKQGRGAYICPDPVCWEKAFKGKQLEINLKSRLTREDRNRLMKDSEDLIKGAVSAQG